MVTTLMRSVWHTTLCICDGRAFIARHARTKDDLFFVAEVKYKSLMLNVVLELKHNRITKVEPAFRRPLLLQILLLAVRASINTAKNLPAQA